MFLFYFYEGTDDVVYLVQVSNDYSTWPHSRMQLSSFAGR